MYPKLFAGPIYQFKYSDRRKHNLTSKRFYINVSTRNSQDLLLVYSSVDVFVLFFLYLMYLHTFFVLCFWRDKNRLVLLKEPKKQILNQTLKLNFNFTISLKGPFLQSSVQSIQLLYLFHRCLLIIHTPIRTKNYFILCAVKMLSFLSFSH